MRIMTTNIWGDYFGNPVDVREDGIYEIYKNYTPDVIGFQEITPGWYNSNLWQKLSSEYYFVGTEIFNNANYVPMAIKKTYELLAKGYEMLEETPDRSKAITWAVVKEKKTERKIAFCNTHFWWKAGDIAHDSLRAKNAYQLSELMKYIRARFGCPVFAFGDMNSLRNSQAFEVVYVVAGMKHLCDMADTKDNICTIHGNPAADEKGFYHGQMPVLDANHSIDHIIALGDGFKVKHYGVITDQYALDATDHSPVYADVEFAE